MGLGWVGRAGALVGTARLVGGLAWLVGVRPARGSLGMVWLGGLGLWGLWCWWWLRWRLPG